MARTAIIVIALAAAILCAQAVPNGYGYASLPAYGGHGHGGNGHGYYADSVANVKVYQNPKHYEFDVVEKGKSFVRHHHQQADTPYAHQGDYSKY